MRYRKKPVVIEAVRVSSGNAAPSWLAEAIVAGVVRIEHDGNIRPFAIIRTLEGEMRANHDDWIIRGVKGELYPCKPDIFEATYEPEAAP